MKVVRSEGGQHQKISYKELVEIHIMSLIDSPYINKLIDYYFQEDQSTGQEELVLLQPLAMCDLLQFLKDNYAEGGMPEKQAIEFLAQLAIGTKAMHDKRIMHRDLNPKNILVFKNEKITSLCNQEFTLKITDFGCSRILKPDEEEAKTLVGKKLYMAPEQTDKGYNPKVDVYGLGITLFQMITGQILNSGDITSRKPNLQCYSPKFIDLLYKLCEQDHEKRPSIDEVIDNPIIQKSQTFINCLLNNILPMSKSKIEGSIDYFRELQEVRTQFKDHQNMWQSQYRLALGDNEKQYLIDKYQREQDNQNFESLLALIECKFKTEVEPNGNIFVGFYKQDSLKRQDGSLSYSKFYGRYYTKDYITEGSLKNGKFNGDTSEYAINAEGNNYFYDGDQVDGNWNGYGVMIWNNGDMYCGEYKNGKRHGQGTYYWSDGKSYEGQWMNNDRHGEGVMKYANGDILKGTQKDDNI
eukprot:403354880